MTSRFHEKADQADQCIQDLSAWPPSYCESSGMVCGQQRMDAVPWIKRDDLIEAERRKRDWYRELASLEG